METVHYFVRGLFRGVAETETVRDQREELETHLEDRIASLVAQGVPPEDAFSRVVDSLGDLGELIDTMTGRMKKVLKRKLDFSIRLYCFLYGTMYMAAVGIWFSLHDFGISALYVALPGWLAFAIPAVYSCIAYVRDPGKIQALETGSTEKFRTSVTGWLLISASCFAVNLLLADSGTFLRVFWSWMPFFGVFSWPLHEYLSNTLVKSMDAIGSE